MMMNNKMKWPPELGTPIYIKQAMNNYIIVTPLSYLDNQNKIICKNHTQYDFIDKELVNNSNYDKGFIVVKKGDEWYYLNELQLSNGTNLRNTALMDPIFNYFKLNGGMNPMMMGMMNPMGMGMNPMMNPMNQMNITNPLNALNQQNPQMNPMNIEKQSENVDESSEKSSDDTKIPKKAQSKLDVSSKRNIYTSKDLSRIENLTNRYRLAIKNDRYFADKITNVHRTLIELQEGRLQHLNDQFGTWLWPYMKNIDVDLEIAEDDQQNVYTITVGFLTPLNQFFIEDLKQSLVARIQNQPENIKKGKDDFSVNDLALTTNTLIKDVEYEQTEALKLQEWIRDNLLIKYEEETRYDEEYYLFADLITYADNGYVNITRAGVTCYDLINKNVVNKRLDLHILYDTKNVDNVMDKEINHIKLLEYMGFKHIFKNSDLLKYNDNVLRKKKEKEKEMEIMLASDNIRSKKSVKYSNDPKAIDAQKILALENFICLQPQPKYLLFILDRLVKAWYADYKLSATIVKIKILINHYRARRDTEESSDLGTLPMIIIYLRYGFDTIDVALSLINFYFTNYMYMGWDGNDPDYYIKYNNLIYYTNGDVDVKKILEEYAEDDSEYYDKLSLNPKGILKYGKDIVSHYSKSITDSAEMEKYIDYKQSKVNLPHEQLQRKTYGTVTIDGNPPAYEKHGRIDDAITT